MKKTIPLLAAMAILLCACNKIVLKRTRVQLIYKHPPTTINFPNDASKHLDISKVELYNELVAQLKDQLDKGRMDWVESDPDYYLLVESIHTTETVNPTMDELGTVHQVSSIKLLVNFSINPAFDDAPYQFQTNQSFSETLVQNQEKVYSKTNDKDKVKAYDDKGNKTCEWEKVCNDDCYYQNIPGKHIQGFGGRNQMLISHAKDARDQLKKFFISRQ